MEGPNAVLNVMTLPPGATQTQARLVLDGVRGAIFLYKNGGPSGALIGSWAMSADNDPYGNPYPQGLDVKLGTIEGTTIIGGIIEGAQLIGTGSGGELLLYSTNPPAANTLVLSSSSAAFTDSVGNHVFQGFAYYYGTGPYTARVEFEDLIEIYTGPDMHTWTLKASFSVDSNQTVTIHDVAANDFAQLGVTGTSGFLEIFNNLSTGSVLEVTSSGVFQASYPSGFAGRLTTELSATTDNTLPNTVTPTPITQSWNIPAGDARAGTEYIIEVPYTGVQENAVLNLGFILDGVFTNLVPVGAAAFPAGDGTVGNIRLHIKCTAIGVTGTVNVLLEGVIADSTVNRASSTTVAPVGYRSAFGFDTTVAHFVSVGGFYTVTAAGQFTTGHGSKFTRSGL